VTTPGNQARKKNAMAIQKMTRKLTLIMVLVELFASQNQ
jgi:hypothetical protein